MDGDTLSTGRNPVWVGKIVSLFGSVAGGPFLIVDLFFKIVASVGLMKLEEAPESAFKMIGKIYC